ncbi:MAG TPA: chorismate mutase [Longimicrobiales bacterium]|nr:chorismate mutase [Longimicrobiales bacterium]
MCASRRENEPPPDLARLRSRIDEIDDALVTLIRDRLRLACAAADTKRLAGRPLRDVTREAEVVRRAAARARTLGVDDDSVRAVFWHLIGLSHLTVTRPRMAPETHDG